MKSSVSNAIHDGAVLGPSTNAKNLALDALVHRDTPSTPSQSYLTPSWYNDIEHFAPLVGDTSPPLLRPITPWTSPPLALSRTTDDDKYSSIVRSSSEVSPTKSRSALLSEASCPFLDCATPPRPMRTIKPRCPPLKLERLGPLRRNTVTQIDNDSKDQIEIPRVSYAKVASLGASKNPPSFRGLTPKRSTGTQTKQCCEKRVETDYKKFICVALKEDNVSLAEEYLHDMILDSYSGTSVAPDGYCYNRVITGYAREGNHEKAKGVLKIMWEDYRHGNKQALPNKQCFTGIMKAWQNSDDKYHAPEACEEVLRKMYILYNDTGNPDFKPDLYAFTVVFHCWANSLREDAVHRAFDTFREMMDRCDDGEKDLIPDNVCYSNLINVLINSKKDDNYFSSIKHAEALLGDMLVEYFEGNDKAAPTTRNFNTILAALSKSSSYPEAALRANDLIEKWETYNKDGKLSPQPDAYSYSLLLKCWVNAPRDDAMEMLQSTVQRLFLMIAQHDQDGNEDNSASIVRFCEIRFTPVIVAFIKNRCTQEAHDLLLHMTRIYKQSSSKSTKPKIQWFESVSTLWSKHPNIEYAADHAASLLRCLEDLSNFDMSIKPNLSVYNSVLLTYRNASQPRRAHALLRKMERRSKQLRMDGPNTTSYRAVLDAWKNEEKEQVSSSSRDSKKIMDSIRWLQNEYRTRFGCFPPP